MNTAILKPVVQKFIREHLKDNLPQLILKGSPIADVSIQEIATQIAGLKIAEKKLPTWFKTKGIIYPPKLNLEQTSSEVTAEYKAKLVSGEHMIDLTGGLGIDSFFFSSKVSQMTYCEKNSELAHIASHNFEQLKANISIVNGDSIDYLKNSDRTYNWVYLDPARRDDYGGKVFRLSDCVPNVPVHLDLLFKKADNILIKTSPLLDISAAIAELKFVKELHIVAVQNDVKELLWVLEKDYKARIRVTTINFTKEVTQEFQGYLNDEIVEVHYELPQNYLYEPNPTIMKSGMFALLGRETNTDKLHPNSHLFTSNEIVDFPGRKFEIISNESYNVKQLKKKLGLKKANIATRNFPDSVEIIRKKLKISDGGDHYLFFTTNLKDEKIVLVCRKIKS